MHREVGLSKLRTREPGPVEGAPHPRLEGFLSPTMLPWPREAGGLGPGLVSLLQEQSLVSRQTGCSVDGSVQSCSVSTGVLYG